MIIKVCGLKDRAQIEQLDQMHSIDWLGTIFYEKSKRFVMKVSGSVTHSKKAGVFVNETIGKIKEIAAENKLDLIQLHGDETPEDCLRLKGMFKVVKAFGIDPSFDFEILKMYENGVDYFLFDTKTIDYGGSGKLFDWSILKKYTLKIPFLLSGGINIDSIEAIKQLDHPMFAGIDINSGFENAPGDKNIELIQQFVIELTDK